MPGRVFAICFVSLLFCSLLLAKEDYPFLGLVSREGINVRAGANINFETLCKLAKNEKVSVIGKSYNWYKITLPKDALCYINERYVALEDSLGLILGNRVNIRAKPGENFSIIGRVNKGERVKILKKSGQWYGIEPTENCFGWVHEKFISYYSEMNMGLLSAPVVANKEGPAKSEPKTKAPLQEKIAQVKKEGAVDNLVSAVGVVYAMGRVFNRAGTHKLVSDGKILYILSGDRAKLENFINYRVKIVGEINNAVSSKYPVIIVKEITACE